MPIQDPYRLRVFDLVTGQPLGRLPVRDVAYEDYIGRSGSLTGTIPVPDAATAQRVQEILQEGRAEVDLERAGQVLWSGPVWTATPTAEDRGRYTCPIRASGLESYYREHHQLRTDLTYTGTDQLAIARALIAYTASRPGGDLGLEVDTGQLSGVLRDRTYSRYDQPYIGQLLDQLASVEDGFEWRIQTYADSSGTRHRALRLGYPKLTAGSADLPLKMPGAIVGYSLPRDATVQANCWQSRGATSNSDQASSSVPLMSALLETPDDIADGWPLLDGSSDYSTVTDQATLDSHAAADLARVVRPVVIPSVAIRTDAVTQPQLGSHVLLKIRDIWYPNTLTARYRVVGLRCRPAERGRPDLTDLFLEAA